MYPIHLSRRSALLALAGGLSGCAGLQLEEKPMSSFLWGSTERLIWNNANGLGYIGVPSPQIVNVSHVRPETWSFILHAHVNSISPGASENIRLAWDLVIGLGRSQVTIRDWAVMIIEPTIIDPTTARPPDSWLTEIPAGPNNATPCRQFPAKTIQLVARGNNPVPDPGIDYDLSISAFVSPVAIGSGKF